MLSKSLSVQAADVVNGKKVVDLNCVACHQTGVMGAPKIGDTAQWTKRTEKGLTQLTKNAIDGIKSMPAKGGNSLLSDQDIKDSIAYFLSAANVKTESASQKTKDSPISSAKSTKEITPQKKKAVPQKASVASTPSKKPIKTVKSGAMKFNRLMKPPSEWNPAPFEDGIHDPDGEGAYTLQAPKEAFSQLNKASSGNRVDWMKSLDNKKIMPRYDRLDETKKPFVMDLNIVREVKGSMPDVVYPHKQHTEWLDCSNCHPDIFIPKKGANQISMASILMGEKCGVCHGKVAFPVSDCRKCHSKKKKTPFVASKNN
nr:c(7)-type cytochrome triheme domain-containing protein [Thalassotalea sp. G2M2-11]